MLPHAWAAHIRENVDPRNISAIQYMLADKSWSSYSHLSSGNDLSYTSVSTMYVRPLEIFYLDSNLLHMTFTRELLPQ